MLRMIIPAAMAMAIFAVSATSFASATSEQGLRELHRHVTATETALKGAPSIKAKVALVRKLRIYVAHELTKQRNVTQPDATDDQLALALIGFDEDLGSFIDEPSHDFSGAQCAGYKIALVHSYTPAGEARGPANLPLHTQESLKILDLLCRK